MELSELPTQAAEGLQAIIAGDYVAPELEDRSYPFPSGSVTRDLSGIWTSQICPIRLDIYGSTNTTQGAYFYYHVDQLHANGYYYNITRYANLVYGSSVLWNDVDNYRTQEDYQPWQCNYRAYVYMWNPASNSWVRLAEEYFP